MKIKRLELVKLIGSSLWFRDFLQYETPVAYQMHTGELFKTEEY